MRRSIPSLMVLIFSFAALPASGQEEETAVIELRTGQVLRGRILARNERLIWFHDADRGDMVVRRAEIAGHGEGAAGAATSIYAREFPADVRTDPPASHVRYVDPRGLETGKGGLETAVTRWRHGETGTVLLLVGAVHIADPAYYRRLQQILDDTDLVLFEGVGRKEGEPLSDEDARSFDGIYQLQVGLKDLLGLDFQKDGLDYRRKHWKNADVDAGTLKREMGARQVALPTENRFVTGILKMALSMFNPERMPADSPLRARLKHQMAAMLGRADVLMKRMGAIQEVLIEFRNEAAMQVLREELATGSLGRTLSLFYGAAHLPGFAETLLKEGWYCQGEDWLLAWEL